jgi:hypothetical protein
MQGLFYFFLLRDSMLFVEINLNHVNYDIYFFYFSSGGICIMQVKATILRTHKGSYLACIDEEKLEYDCDDQCNSCPYPCRILLEKDQNIENGRFVLAELEIPLINDPGRLIPALIGIYAASFVFMILFRNYALNIYKGWWPVVLSGFFASALFYFSLKLKNEKGRAADTLRKGKILRVYSRDS